MPKWFGIRVSAVIAILGSLLTLLAAASMGFAAFNSSRLDTPEAPLPVKPILMAMAVVFMAFAGWGIASAIGIFTRKNWARLSIIIFAVLLVGMGGSALIGVLFIRFPENAQVSREQMQIARLAIASVYGAMAVIGTWWLLLFNSSATRRYFAEPEARAGGRPLSVAIIAWYLLISAFGMGVAAILRPPAMVFGLVLTSWASLLIYTAFTAIQIYLGTGLLSLQESARVGAIAYFALLIVNMVVSVVIPGFERRMDVMVQSLPAWARTGQAMQSFQGAGGLMLSGTLMLAIPIWLLVSRRSAFRS